MTLISKCDEAPSYEGPVVLYIKERIWFCLPQKQVGFFGLYESKWHTRDYQGGRTPRTQPAEGMAETVSPFLSCRVFTVARGTWAVEAWLLIPPPCFHSPGSWHCHLTGKGPRRQSFPGNRTEVLELLFRQLRLGTLLCQERKVQFVTCLSPHQLLIYKMTQMTRPDISSAPWKGWWSGC